MIFDGAELPSLLSIERATEVLGVDAPTLEAWIQEGRFEAVRVGGRVRVVTSFIEDRRGQPTFCRRNDESRM